METKIAIVTLFCVHLVFETVLAANQIKGLDDAILFRLTWPGSENSLLESPDYEKLVMTTPNNEQYQCLIPINYGDDGDDSDIYTGPNPLTLLMPLFKKQTCNLWLESYWTYELCHGIHLKQYREEREGKSPRRQEYILGILSMEELRIAEAKLDEDLRANPNPVIPTTKIEGMDMPYFMINYTDGTICDLTGKPRVSHILFVCYEKGRHDIHSIKETFTCEYEIVVLSPNICQHPFYRPRELPQTDLHCIPMSGAPKRPRNLRRIETESLKMRSNGAMLSGVSSSGSIKLEVVDDPDHPSIASVTPEPPAKLSLFPPQPAIDQKLVQDFLNGEYCLHGGSGWWKYEFCYGRKVEQYHEDRDGSRTVILLGQFDLEGHRAWILKHPEKVYKPGRRYVSHFYSGGTTCDLTGRPRQVEVKLKCKESQSPSSVTLYLLEPETCEYTLGVETSIICPLLQHADTLGLFTQSQGKEEAEGTIDPAILVEEIMQSQHPEGEVEEVEEEVEELEVVEEQQVVIVEEKVVMLVEEEGVEEGETGDEEGDVKGERLSQKEKSKGETQPSGTPREEGQP